MKQINDQGKARKEISLSQIILHLPERYVAYNKQIAAQIKAGKGLPVYHQQLITNHKRNMYTWIDRHISISLRNSDQR